MTKSGIKKQIQSLSTVKNQIHKVLNHRSFSTQMKRAALVGLLLFSNDGFILLSNNSNVMGSINEDGKSTFENIRNNIRIGTRTSDYLQPTHIISLKHPAFTLGSSTVIGNIPNFIDFAVHQEDTNHKTTVNINLPAKIAPYQGNRFKIMGEGRYSAQQLAYFITNNNQNISFNKAFQLASLYIKQANYEGVNHDIAFVQMCHETGFLRYNGVVSPDQNNFCGLGTVNDYTPGEVFKTQEEGVIAHIQHLKAYASKESLKGKLIDNRFRFVKRGTATHVKDLTGRWAADRKYAEKIHKLIHRLNTQTQG